MMERKELPALEAALDRALADCLRPPALTQDFPTRLRQAVDRRDAGDLERRRATLELEFQHNFARLQSGFVRRRRAAIGFFLLAAVSVGAALDMLLPHLHQLSTVAVTPAGQAVSVAIGIGIAMTVWLARVGNTSRLL
jgi:hypothetical protein